MVGQGEQPTAKRAKLGRVLQPADAAVHRPQNLLGKVGGIRVLKLMPPGVAINKRGVQVHELPPGVAVVRIAQANQQTGPGAGWLGHSLAPWGLLLARGQILSRNLAGFYAGNDGTANRKWCGGARDRVTG